jgi:hypothetical protein
MEGESSPEPGDIGGKTRRKETIGKTTAYVGEY